MSSFTTSGEAFVAFPGGAIYSGVGGHGEDVTAG